MGALRRGGRDGRGCTAAPGAVDDLLDAPVQTFTSILAENEVLSELYDEQPDRETADE